MKCIVVTPEKTEIDQEVSFVAAPLFDGEYGIGQGHSPVVARIGAGELRLTSPAGQKSLFFIEGGFLEVAGDIVSILTDRVIDQAGISYEQAQADLETAKKLPQTTPETAALKERAVRAARNRAAVAEKWGKK